MQKTTVYDGRFVYVAGINLNNESKVAKPDGCKAVNRIETTTTTTTRLNQTPR